MSEETYSFLCPSCSAHLSVPVSMAGVSGPCPYCASAITSPMPEQVPAEDLRAIESFAEATARDSGSPSAFGGEPTPSHPAPARTAAVSSEAAPEDYGSAQHGAGGVGVETMAAEEAGASRVRHGGRGKRGKRGNRLPKGGGNPQRREPAPGGKGPLQPQQVPNRAEPQTVALAAPDAGQGLSLFTKACLGVAGVALVALAAVYGLPAIMSDGDPVGDPASTVPEGKQANIVAEPATSASAGRVAPTPPADSGVTPEEDAFATNARRPLPVIPEPEGLPDLPDAPDAPPLETPVPDTDTSLPDSLTTYTPAADSILIKPRQALDGFLAAPNWKDRLQYATGGESLASEMRAYYLQYPDGPLNPESINWTLNEKDPDGKTEIFVFTASFDVEENGEITYLDFPVVVEARDGKYSVNWHSFVEFKDRHLNEFITKRAFDQPRKFHVIAVRSHYFGSDSELKSKVESGEFLAVTASAPNPDDSTQAFLNTRNKSGREMASSLAWEKAAFGQFDTPLVELCWKKTSAGTPYIEITEVLGDKWRDTPK